MNTVLERLRQQRETENKEFLDRYGKKIERADIAAEIMARYRANGKAIFEIEYPRLTEISDALGRPKDTDSLQEIWDIGQDIKKILEKKL